MGLIRGTRELTQILCFTFACLTKHVILKLLPNCCGWPVHADGYTIRACIIFLDEIIHIPTRSPALRVS